MLRNLFFIVMLAAPSFLHAQSSVKIVSNSGQVLYIKISNGSGAIEESGTNITVANIPEGKYDLWLKNSTDSNALWKHVFLSLTPYTRTSIYVNDNLSVNNTVIDQLDPSYGFVNIDQQIPTVINTPPPYIARKHRMSNKDYETLFNRFRGMHFDSERTLAIDAAAKYSMFTAQQIAQLIATWDFNATKLEYAKKLFENTIDKQNYLAQVSPVLFSLHVNELADYINKYN